MATKLRNFYEITKNPLFISPLLRGRKRGGRGFTIIEAVVSVSVFAIAMTSIMGVFLSVQRLNRQSASFHALQQNGRFVSEDITKTIRNGRVNYAAYGASVQQPSTGTLNLIDESGAAVSIYLQGNDLMISKPGGTARYTGTEVRVLGFQVFIWPARDPFLPSALIRQQPTVTVFLDLESVAVSPTAVRIPFQFTTATKEYPVIE